MANVCGSGTAPGVYASIKSLLPLARLKLKEPPAVLLAKPPRFRRKAVLTFWPASKLIPPVVVISFQLYASELLKLLTGPELPESVSDYAERLTERPAFQRAQARMTAGAPA